MSFKKFETCYYWLDTIGHQANQPKHFMLGKVKDSGEERVKVAAFDVDWTLTYGERHLFPRLATDIHLLPRRLETLLKLQDEGFLVVAFTNQACRSKKEEETKLARLKTFVESLGEAGVKVSLFMASRKDTYRKPEGGMWTLMERLLGVKADRDVSFFCGDAMGRPQDFSDSDMGFALNCWVTPQTPQDIFGVYKMDGVLAKDLIKKKWMVLMVGAPGTGKTTFFRENFEDLGFLHINQDTLRTKARVAKAFEAGLKGGESMCVDGTNPCREDREFYYRAAGEAGYALLTIYFVRDGRGWNQLREAKAKVPTIAYHCFFKKLDPPRPSTTPGRLELID